MVLYLEYASANHPSCVIFLDYADTYLHPPGYFLDTQWDWQTNVPDERHETDPLDILASMTLSDFVPFDDAGTSENAAGNVLVSDDGSAR